MPDNAVYNDADLEAVPIHLLLALQARQRLILEVLAATTAWSIQGQGLELLDAAGQPLAVLEAVYLH